MHYNNFRVELVALFLQAITSENIEYKWNDP